MMVTTYLLDEFKFLTSFCSSVFMVVEFLSLIAASLFNFLDSTSCAFINDSTFLLSTYKSIEEITLA